MWATLLPMAVSAFTAISGMSGGNRAGAEGERYLGMGVDSLKQKTKLAMGNLDRFNKNAIPERDILAQEAFGAGPTKALGRELGQYQKGMAEAQDQILGNADSTPTGLIDSNLANLKLAGGMGKAKLQINDEERKYARQRDMLAYDSQTPDAVKNAQDAYQAEAGFFGRVSDTYNQQASQAYQGAGAAMGSIAQMFSSGLAAKK